MKSIYKVDTVTLLIPCSSYTHQKWAYAEFYDIGDVGFNIFTCIIRVDSTVIVRVCHKSLNCYVKEKVGSEFSLLVEHIIKMVNKFCKVTPAWKKGVFG